MRAPNDVAAALRRAPIACALIACVGCSSLRAGDDVDTIGRSTLVETTASAPRGLVEVQLATAYDPDEELRTELTVNAGLTDATQLSVVLEPWARLEDGDRRVSGGGDVAVGLVTRFVEETAARPSVAFGLAALLPTGDPDVSAGSGEVDAFASLVVERTLEPFVVAGAYEVGALGRPDADGADLSHALRATAATSFAPGWAGVLGLGHAWTAGDDSEETGADLGIAISLGPGALLEVAGAVDLGDGGPEPRIGLGLLVSF